MVKKIKVNISTAKESITALTKKFHHKQGRHRLTLLINDKWVVKIPVENGNYFDENGNRVHDYCSDYDTGLEANLKEAEMYAAYNKKLLSGKFDRYKKCKFAKCKMINFRGRPALLMERFNIDFGFQRNYNLLNSGKYHVPDWAWGWDCMQVGVFENSDIRLYDYAEDWCRYG